MHWLLNDHLHKIHEISPDFLSVSVSGIDASNLLCGRPSILYRKSLSSVISSLDSNSVWNALMDKISVAQNHSDSTTATIPVRLLFE